MKIYDKLEAMKFVEQLDNTIMKIFNRANHFKEPLSVFAVAQGIHTLYGLREKIVNREIKPHDIMGAICEAMDDLKLVDKPHRALACEWVTWLNDLKTDYFVMLTEEV